MTVPASPCHALFLGPCLSAFKYFTLNVIYPVLLHNLLCIWDVLLASHWPLQTLVMGKSGDSDLMKLLAPQKDQNFGTPNDTHSALTGDIKEEAVLCHFTQIKVILIWVEILLSAGILSSHYAPKHCKQWDHAAA